MPMTRSELRSQLSSIELDERTFAGLSPADVESLTELLHDEEAWLAARAVHALSKIDSPAAHDAMLAAAELPRLEVRVAAAISAAALPPDRSDEVLLRLLGDPQAGVRKFAVKSVSERNGSFVKRRVEEIAEADADHNVRRRAADKSNRL